MIVLDTNIELNGATTQYTYSFDSMINFNGIILGASSSGLFSMSGDDDNGTDIDAYFELGTTDFGISNEKHIRYLYLGGEANGILSILLSTEQSASVELAADLQTAQAGRRIACRRDVRGRYHTIRIKNNSGCDFSIDTISAVIIPCSHGRNSN